MKSKMFPFFIFYLFLCTRINFSQNYYGTFHDWTLKEIMDLQNTQLLEASGYKGVMFVFPGSYISNWKIDATNARRILNELNNRFNEMIDAYKRYKSNPEGYKGNDIRDSWEKNLLPSCITEAIDKLLNDFKNQKKFLFIVWSIEGEEWGDSGTEYYGGGNGSGHNDTPLEKYGGIDVGRIEIYDVYAFRGLFNNILTSSLLFHELVHAVKNYYPDCFQVKLSSYKKNKKKEEASTEDSTSKIFGGMNTNHYYEVGNGWNEKGDDAIYKKVCICKQGCPPDNSK